MNTLAVDIGGTFCRFAIFSNSETYGEWSFRTSELLDLHEILTYCRRYSEFERIIDRLVVAVAGPVSNGSGRLTNTGQRISMDELQLATGISKISLINDFAALARSLPNLSCDQILRLRGHVDIRASATAVIGVGTGLGTAVRLVDGMVFSTEAGHIALPSSIQRQIVNSDKHAKLSTYEDILSGNGIVKLYNSNFDNKKTIINPIEYFEIQKNNVFKTPDSKIISDSIIEYCKTIMLTFPFIECIAFSGSILRYNHDYIFSKDLTDRIAWPDVLSKNTFGPDLVIVMDEFAALAGMVGPIE